MVPYNNHFKNILVLIFFIIFFFNLFVYLFIMIEMICGSSRGVIALFTWVEEHMLEEGKKNGKISFNYFSLVALMGTRFEMPVLYCLQ